MNKEAALVVFSGGQDSTTCLFWAKREFRKVYALSFLYGQKHQKEVELAREIARKAEVEFEVMDVSFIGKLGHNSLTDPDMVMDREKPADSVPNTFVPGRNLFFLSIAAVYAREKGINHIVTGVSQTDFSGYPDCREQTAMFESALWGYRTSFASSGLSDASLSMAYYRKRVVAYCQCYAGRSEGILFPFLCS